MTEVRVRFAPSPTGTLHIGGVRTALYSWLYARQKGGRFILRVEDTDQERSTEESAKVIVDSMRWLGLDWDEGPEVGGASGPYFQSQRLDLYREAAEKLIASGHAYRCYATKEEIDAAREEFAARTGRKEGFSFESPYRDGKESGDRSARHVIRFKAPRDGATSWDDLVKGRIEIQHSTLQDFVLVRPDGMPLYNLGCVVDDLAMGITLVARGDDHMINTTPQILLYQALGAAIPTFAHVPMVLAPNGQKLSKRHAAVGVLDYRDLGYVPDAVLNYLVRLGWSFGDQEIFTRAELIEKFSWDRVGAQASRYDAQKFAYVQAEHLRMLSDEVLAAGTSPFLAARGVNVASDDPRLVRAMPFLKPRAVTFPDLADGAIYLLVDEPEMDEKAASKFLTAEAAPHLRWLIDVVKDVEPFTDAVLAPKVEQAMEAGGLTMKQIAQPARVALTGRTKSPGLFEVMELLGKEASLARLERAVAQAST
jgi:glutamyl-tRNA synthetase